MAAIVKNTSGGPSLATMLVPAANKHSGQWFAGAALGAFDAVYIDSAGLVQKSQDTGATTAPAQVDGYAARACVAGEPVTILFGIEVNYTAAAGLTPGAVIFLSASVAGGLDTAVSNAHAPVGKALTDRIAYLHKRTF